MEKKSRHTVGYDGKRTSGMVIGTLYWSYKHDEADVKMKLAFDEMSSIGRLDALNDIIGLLEREYAYQMTQCYGKKGKKK
jgi:hypothetical protein